MKKNILLMAALAMTLSVAAQQERKFIREGNGLFHTQDFEKAEVEYRKALEQEEASYAAAFNLADAMYKQKKYDEALQQFSSLAKDQSDKERLGHLYHNIGNTLLAQNKFDESIEAYKQSLRNRPDSQETKYNLEFARKMKQEQENQDQNKDQNQDQQNQDQQNQDQQDQDKQDQDKQDQDKQDQNQDQQDQNKDQDKDQQDQDKDQQDKNQDKDGQQPPPEQQQQQQELKISPEEAKRLLDALAEDEKKTQEKVQKEKVEAQKAKRMKIEKNW